MEKNSKSEKLKKLLQKMIQEEVQKELKPLKAILQEIKLGVNKKDQQKYNPITPPSPSVPSNNIFASLLQETAQNLNPREFIGNNPLPRPDFSDMMMTSDMLVPQTQQVMPQMIESQPVAEEEFMGSVPDFSAIMGVMKEKKML